MTTIYSTADDYPSEEFRRRFHEWVARPLKGRMQDEVDPFAWCRRNLTLMALWHLDLGPDDSPQETPFTIQDAFELMEKGLRK